MGRTTGSPSFMYGGEMKPRKLTATDESGREYVFQSMNVAVRFLRIAHTTIQRHVADGTPVDTSLGRVVIRDAD